jgi:excisionase family DNA binding protein
MQLISPKTLAKACEVPLSWVYTRIREGTIPYIKIGHYVRFEERAIQEWLNEHRRGTQGPHEDVPCAAK